MKTQIKAASLAAAALICSAGLAGAADLNIYGASAQGDFWIAEAVPFMRAPVASGGLGCTTTDPVGATAAAYSFKVTFDNIQASDPKTPTGHGQGETVNYGIATGSGCDTGKVPGGSITIRTAGIASGEGALAANLNDPLDNDLNLASNAGTATCANNGERLMANTVTGLVAGHFWGAGNVGGKLSCYKVHVGTTDLDIADIDQVAATDSSLDNNYPLPTDRLGTGDTSKTDFTTLNYDEALVVPFQFVVNSSVTARFCYDTVTGVSTRMAPLQGCTTDAQCNTPAVASGHTRSCGAAEVVDSLTRNQIVNLFAGKVNNWSAFTGFTPQAVKVAVRVPGSGTHAALDRTVMTSGNTGFGANIYGYNNPPFVNYVATSDNMVAFVQTNAGSVGYVDADKGLGTNTSVIKIGMGGQFPGAAQIRNCGYDFWTIGRMYRLAATISAAGNGTVVDQLVSFAKKPNNIPGITAFTGSGTKADPYVQTVTAATKGSWWNTVSSLQCYRSSADSYPLLDQARAGLVWVAPTP